MIQEQGEKMWQLSPSQRVKFLGFSTAWWLLLAPRLSGIVPESPLSEAVKVTLRWSHVALGVFLLAAMFLLAATDDDSPPRECARCFVTAVLTMMLLFMLGFLPRA